MSFSTHQSIPSTDPEAFRTTVVVERQFAVSVAALWQLAGHPAKVAFAVPMLRGFSAPRNLRLGSAVAEIHTILGWPQLYIGRITVYEPQRRWGMSNLPRGRGPFPLPHVVQYDFSAEGGASRLTLTCCFDCGGLLSLPGGSSVLAWTMRHALARVLSGIERLSGARGVATAL